MRTTNAFLWIGRAPDRLAGTLLAWIGVCSRFDWGPLGYVRLVQWYDQWKWRRRKRQFRRENERAERGRRQGATRRGDREWAEVPTPSGMGGEAAKTGLGMALVALVLVLVGLVGAASSLVMPDSPFLVLVLAAVAVALLLYVSSRLPAGPWRRVAIVATIALTIGATIWSMAALSLVAMYLRAYWQLALLGFLAAIGLWTWHLGREE